jgi:hypothetical protein
VPVTETDIMFVKEQLSEELVALHLKNASTFSTMAQLACIRSVLPLMIYAHYDTNDIPVIN